MADFPPQIADVEGRGCGRGHREGNGNLGILGEERRRREEHRGKAHESGDCETHVTVIRRWRAFV